MINRNNIKWMKKRECIVINMYVSKYWMEKILACLFGNERRKMSVWFPMILNDPTGSMDYKLRCTMMYIRLHK